MWHHQYFYVLHPTFHFLSLLVFFLLHYLLFNKQYCISFTTINLSSRTFTEPSHYFTIELARPFQPQERQYLFFTDEATLKEVIICGWALSSFGFSLRKNYFVLKYENLQNYSMWMVVTPSQCLTFGTSYAVNNFTNILRAVFFQITFQQKTSTVRA